MITYLGGESVAGGKMKSVAYWTYPDNIATNESGFSALPAGFRGYPGSFSDRQGNFGYGYGTMFMGLSSYFLLNNSQSLISSGSNLGILDKKNGGSIRCLKN